MANRVNPDEVKQILLSYNKLQNISQVGEIYKRASATIKTVLIKNGISNPKTIWRRKYSFDFHYFEDITTEEQAYWLGFIMADGSVHGNSLSIELHQRDISHLEKFKQCIRSTNPISLSAKNCCAIQLTHPYLVKDLEKYNVVPNKSKKAGFPKNIPNDLMVHYIRGLIDGDGWITVHKNKKGFTYEFGFSSGVKEIMDGVCSVLYEYAGGKCGTLRHRKKDKQSCYQLIIGGRLQSQKLAKVLYGNATIYLDRKHKLAIEAMKGLDTKISRNQYSV